MIVPAPLPKLTEDDLIHGYRHDMTFTMGATRQAKLPEVCPKCGLRPPGDLNRTSGERLVRHFKSKHADDRGRATLKLNAETRFEFTFLTPDTGTDGRRILVVGDLTPWMVTTLILDEYTIEWWRDGANVPVNE